VTWIGRVLRETLFKNVFRITRCAGIDAGLQFRLRIRDGSPVVHEANDGIMVPFRGSFRRDIVGKRFRQVCIDASR